MDITFEDIEILKTEQTEGIKEIQDSYHFFSIFYLIGIIVTLIMLPLQAKRVITSYNKIPQRKKED
jgi:uncharacterized membrane protein affecting hemolysin expression